MVKQWKQDKALVDWYAENRASDEDKFYSHLVQPFLYYFFHLWNSRERSGEPWWNSFHEGYFECRTADTVPQNAFKPVGDTSRDARGFLEEIIQHRIHRQKTGGSFGILDLGGGEGWLGLWLDSWKHSYVVIDESELFETHFQARRSDLIDGVRQGQRFLKADLDNLNAIEKALRDAEAFANKRSTAERSIPAVDGGRENNDYDQFSQDRPSIVTILNVLEYLEDPVTLLATVRAWLQAKDPESDVPIVVSTLSPNLFRMSRNRSRSQQRNATAAPSSERINILYGPDSSDHELIARGLLDYERIFLEAGLEIVFVQQSTVAELPLDLQKALYQQAEQELDVGSEGALYAGPFTFWILRPDPMWGLIAVNEVAHEDKSSLLKSLSSLNPIAGWLAAKLHARKRLGDVHLIERGPYETVRPRWSFSPGLFLVARGAIHRMKSDWPREAVKDSVDKSGNQDRRKTPQIEKFSLQTFHKGAAFGELELGTNLLCDRFHDELIAGEDGGSCILIPSRVIGDLLEEEEKQSTVSYALFKTLRERFSEFSWLQAVAKDGSDRGRYHRFARAVMLSLTVEYRYFNSMQSLVVAMPSAHVPNLFSLASNERRKAARFLVKCGAVDTLNLKDIQSELVKKRSRVAESRVLSLALGCIGDCLHTVSKQAFDLLVRDVLVELSSRNGQPKLEEVENVCVLLEESLLDQLPKFVTFSSEEASTPGDVFLSKSGTVKLRFKGDTQHLGKRILDTARDILDQSPDRRQFPDAKDVLDLVERWFNEVMIAHYLMLQPQTSCFVFVRDLSLLRRWAYADERLRALELECSELTTRLDANIDADVREMMDENNGVLQSMTPSRVAEYIKSIERYIVRHWEVDLSVRLNALSSKKHPLLSSSDMKLTGAYLQLDT